MAPRKSKISKREAGSSVADDEPPQPPTKDIYRNGDLILVVGEDFGPAHRFRVSRDTMCMASPVWSAMLSRDGQFCEAARKEVTFADDDPDALLLILQIAHLQFQEAYEVMELEELLEVAILCDKYDTVAMVRPFIPRWVEPFLRRGYDELSGDEEYLTIAWTFGYHNEFEGFAKYLVEHIRTNDRGHCVNEKGRIIGWKMPPDIIENLLAIREASVLRFIESFYVFYNQVYDGDNCQIYSSRADATVHRDCCYALHLGRLIQGYKSIGQASPRRTAEEVAAASADIHASISEIYEAIGRIEVRNLIEDQRLTPDLAPRSHAVCNFSSEMHSDMVDRLDDFRAMDPVLESHRAHMKTQWAKGNVEPEYMMSPISPRWD
ncbi:hypothetical protein FKW77_001026 [Venturia effusa]|uniref:BTB domain-containing protein n=1 Tax=Venturia effusa TaxID=50376 RepID=A0A517LBW1_9PEZI|nr:hypothetical protein FKW77_001026 [Venturia effusa]